MEGIGVERIFPEFEFLNYTANRSAWHEALQDGSAFFGVCGNSLAALPLVFEHKNFSIWVASTLYEDRIDRLRREPLLRRLRDYASLPFLLSQERRVFKHARKIFALSRYTERKIVDKYPFVKDKIEVMPYPIDTELFRPTSSASRTTTVETILFTGRLSDERKNIPLLLAAFAEFHRHKPEVVLRLVGAPLSKTAQGILKELKLEDSVTVLPMLGLNEIRKEYTTASLFVIPSFQEGLCISGLEAMSSGLPIITTRCGGPEDFVQEGKNGMLVPVADKEKLSAALSVFFNLSDTERRAMSAAARSFVLEHHALEVLRPKFLGVFGL
jgi:glycosyltransferase involved in cell wall biosynthesis